MLLRAFQLVLLVSISEIVGAVQRQAFASARSSRGSQQLPHRLPLRPNQQAKVRARAQRQQAVMSAGDIRPYRAVQKELADMTPAIPMERAIVIQSSGGIHPEDQLGTPTSGTVMYSRSSPSFAQFGQVPATAAPAPAATAAPALAATAAPVATVAPAAAGALTQPTQPPALTTAAPAAGVAASPAAAPPPQQASSSSGGSSNIGTLLVLSITGIMIAAVTVLIMQYRQKKLEQGRLGGVAVTEGPPKPRRSYRKTLEHGSASLSDEMGVDDSAGAGAGTKGADRTPAAGASSSGGRSGSRSVTLQRERRLAPTARASSAGGSDKTDSARRGSASDSIGEDAAMAGSRSQPTSPYQSGKDSTDAEKGKQSPPSRSNYRARRQLSRQLSRDRGPTAGTGGSQSAAEVAI